MNTDPMVLEVSCSADEQTHLCPITTIELGRLVDGTTITALCGHEIVPAALATPPGGDCPECYARPHRRPGQRQQSR